MAGSGFEQLRFPNTRGPRGPASSRVGLRKPLLFRSVTLPLTVQVTKWLGYAASVLWSWCWEVPPAEVF